MLDQQWLSRTKVKIESSSKVKIDLTITLLTQVCHNTPPMSKVRSIEVRSSQVRSS